MLRVTVKNEEREKERDTNIIPRVLGRFGQQKKAESEKSDYLDVCKRRYIF